MDEQTRFAVEISKINFLLENLYAISMRNAGIDADGVEVVADEMRRQATDLPAKSYGPEPTPKAQREYMELLGHRLDAFWSGVQERLRSVPDR